MTILCKKCGVKEANFVVSDEKTPSFCIDCKEGDFKRLPKKQSICKYPGCSSQRSFGFIGGKKTYCASHKEAGMVNLKYSRCNERYCKLVPCYEDNSKNKFCFIHCIRGMKCLNADLALKQMGKYF